MALPDEEPLFEFEVPVNWYDGNPRSAEREFYEWAQFAEYELHECFPGGGEPPHFVPPLTAAAAEGWAAAKEFYLRIGEYEVWSAHLQEELIGGLGI
jgi:hypothetical protein